MQNSSLFWKLASLFLVVVVTGTLSGLRCPDPCLNNEHCRNDSFCAKRAGDCDGVGFCVPRPEACYEIYAPVCGCDGRTYDNDCYAAAAGVNIAYEGACGSPACRTNDECSQQDGLGTEYCEKSIGDCDGIGICVPRPEACYEIYAPVCGCDGRTYDNDCYAAAAGVNIAYEGACGSPACRTNDECSQQDGLGTEYCEKSIGDCDGIGICVPRPEACYEIYAPVCGCDGRTYDNDCYAAAAGVNIAHERACRWPGCLNNEECSVYDPSVYPDNYCAKEMDDCEGLGICIDRPEACPLDLLPVCGCDGNTYPSGCEAVEEGVNVLAQGPCEEFLCDPADCGPPPLMPNYLCEDGTWAGPTGRCLLSPAGTCGWEIRSCP